MWHVINSINEISCSCPLCDVWIHLPSLNYISNCAEPSFVELVLHFKASSHSVNAPISKYKIIFISFVHQVINWIWRESLSHVELMQIIKFVLNLNPAQQIVVFNTLLYLIKLAAWVSFFPHQIEIIIIFNWIYLLFRIVFLSRWSFTLCNSIQCVNLCSVSFWQMLTHCLTSRICSIVDSTQKPKTLSFFFLEFGKDKHTFSYLSILFLQST